MHTSRDESPGARDRACTVRKGRGMAFTGRSGRLRPADARGFTIAELLIAPLGLALLLRCAPPGLIGIATGLWYGASALGYLASGEIGALWSRWPTRNVLLLLTALPAVGAVVFSWLNRNRPLQTDGTAP